MLYTIEESIGIDAVIEKVKGSLYAKMQEDFPNCSFDGFGRVYRSIKDVGLVPEFRIREEYRDVYLDDRKDGLFAFLPSERSETEDEFVFTNDVKVIFFLNLNSMYGAYLDAKAHKDIVSILRATSARRYQINSVEVGTDNVLRGFYTERIKHANIAPYHFFSVDVKVFFNLNEC